MLFLGKVKKANDSVHLGITTKILLMLLLSYNFNYRSQAIPNYCSHSNCNSVDSARLFTDEDNTSTLLLLGEVQLFYLYPSYRKLYFILFLLEWWLLQMTKVLLNHWEYTFRYVGKYSCSSELHIYRVIMTSSKIQKSSIPPKVIPAISYQDKEKRRWCSPKWNILNIFDT